MLGEFEYFVLEIPISAKVLTRVKSGKFEKVMNLGSF
jgi:hypothetical protein